MKNKTVAFAVVNGLTTLRFVFSVLFLNQLYKNHTAFLDYLILFALIAATDFLDGRWARKWQVQSKFGSVMDVAADFFFILSSCFVLFLHGYLSLWVVLLIPVKLSEFIVTSRILKREQPEDSAFVFDFPGRVAAFLLYILPITVIGLRKGLPDPLFSRVLFLLLLLIFGMAIFSGVHRIRRCVGCRK